MTRTLSTFRLGKWIPLMITFAAYAVPMVGCAESIPGDSDSPFDVTEESLGTVDPVGDGELGIKGDPIFSLRVVSSNKCLDVPNSSTRSIGLQQYDCNGTSAQKFIMKHLGNGEYNIINVNSRMCLDVEQGSTARGARIIQYPCHGAENQKFWFQRASASNGFIMRIISLHSRRCLHLPYQNVSRGAPVDQWTCHKGTNEKFTLISGGETGGEGGGGAGGAGGSGGGGSDGSGGQGGGGDTGSTAKTLYTTSVRDNLDPSDRTVMVDRMAKVGYTAVGANTNVSSDAFRQLLKRTDIKTLYHTGHGFEGGIATAGGSFVYGQAESINVENVILATCLSLSTTGWTQKMGSRSNSILGYTKVSFDSIDNDVASRLASSVGSGQSYIRGWYAANASSSSLSDRWCGYVRESGRIVEYSARSGRIPTKMESQNLETIDPSGLIKASRALISDSRKFQREFQNKITQSYTATSSADHEVAFYTKAPDFLSHTSITRAQATSIAEQWMASAQKPSDTILDIVAPIEVTREDGTQAAVAYRVRYVRSLNGLAVRTNGAEHHFEALVNDKAVVASSKLWPGVAAQTAPQTMTSTASQSVGEILSRAAPNLARLAKSPINIVAVEPCYGSNTSGTIVPAYAFEDETGAKIIVDATTASLVK